MNQAIGIILAGGIGVRANFGFPKQYYKLLGNEVISYSINAFKSSSKLDTFYVVLDKDEYENGRINNEYGVDTICGGITRNESFKNALDYIASHNPECDKIFVNEAARPMITSKIIDDYISYLDTYDYIYSAAKITDSLEHIDGCFANREEYILVRSPEGYHFKEIFASFKPDSKTTFPGHTLSRTSKSYRYYEYNTNFKLTYSEDIPFLEDLLKRRK